MSAEVTVDFIGKDASLEKAFANLEKRVDSSKKKIKELEDASKSTGITFTRMAAAVAVGEAAWAVFSTAVQSVTKYSLASIQAAAQQEKQFTRLSSVIKNNGDAYGTTAKQLSELSDRLALQTGFTSEANNEAMIFLATLKNISAPDQFKEVLTVSQDLATVFGMSLPSAAKAVGKALDNPVQGMINLRKYGVMLTEQQKQQVAGFMAVNDIASAQAVIMDNLKSKVAGAAGDQGKTGTGQLDRLNNLLEQMKEKFGQGMLDVVIKETEKLLENSESLLRTFTALGKVMGSLLQGSAGFINSSAQIILDRVIGDTARAQARARVFDEGGTPEQAIAAGQIAFDEATGRGAAKRQKQAEENAARKQKQREEFDAKWAPGRQGGLINTDVMYNNRLPNGKYITDAPDQRAMTGPQLPGSEAGMSKMERDKLIERYKQDMSRIENNPAFSNFTPGLLQFGRAAWNNRGMLPGADAMIRGAGDLAGQFAPKGFQSTFEDAQGMYDRIQSSAGSTDNESQIAANTKATVDLLGGVKDEVIKVGTIVGKNLAATFQDLNPF